MTCCSFSSWRLVAIGSALGMLLSRSAVYAALFLVLNFGTVAVFYILLNAPFIAMSQVSVYAGAIMVLFLFVIMLLGTRIAAALESAALAAAGWPLLLALVLVGRGRLPAVRARRADRGHPAAGGELRKSAGVGRGAVQPIPAAV